MHHNHFSSLCRPLRDAMNRRAYELRLVTRFRRLNISFISSALWGRRHSFHTNCCQHRSKYSYNSPSWGDRTFSAVEYVDGGEEAVRTSGEHNDTSTTVPKDSALYSSYSARSQLDSRSRTNTWELARRRNALHGGAANRRRETGSVSFDDARRLHRQREASYSQELLNEMLIDTPSCRGESRSTYAMRKIPLNGVSGYQEIISETEEAQMSEELLKILQDPRAAYITTETRYCINLFERQLGVSDQDALALDMKEATPTLYEVLNRFLHLGLIPSFPNVCQVSEMIGNFSGYPVKEKPEAIGAYFGLLNLVSPSVLYLQHKSCPWFPRMYLSQRSLTVVTNPCLSEFKFGYKQRHQPFHTFEYGTRVSKDYRLEILFATVEVEHLKHLRESIDLTDYASKRLSNDKVLSAPHKNTESSFASTPDRVSSTDIWIKELRQKLFNPDSEPASGEQIRREAEEKSLKGKSVNFSVGAQGDEAESSPGSTAAHRRLKALRARYNRASEIQSEILLRDPKGATPHVLHDPPHKITVGDTFHLPCFYSTCDVVANSVEIIDMRISGCPLSCYELFCPLKECFGPPPGSHRRLHRRVVEALPTSPPIRAVVLTMVPNGGAMTKAMRVLGYTPYTLEDTFTYGRALTHPQEWLGILEGQKAFDPFFLNRTSRAKTQLPSYDCIIGPPATLAFESILPACPPHTRIILVEEPDKTAWARDMEIVMGTVSNYRNHGEDEGSHSTATAVGSMPTAERLAGSLELFEEHVKASIPADRLLIFRSVDGWEPLCSFLGLQGPPTDAQGPLPFPAYDNGIDTFVKIRDALSISRRVVAVGVLIILSITWVLFSYAASEFREEMKLFYRYTKRKFEPYFNSTAKSDAEEDPTKTLSFRKAMILAKKSALEYGDSVDTSTAQISQIRSNKMRLSLIFDGSSGTRNPEMFNKRMTGFESTRVLRCYSPGLFSFLLSNQLRDTKQLNVFALLNCTAMSEEENPFSVIRPVMRSEEDDIRRGVFSRALRNLAQSSTDEKFKWCAVIDTEKATFRGKRSSEVQPSENETVGMKRERSPDAVPLYMQSADEANRYIGAFLHSQIEKAIGTTLNSLPPGALRVLCSILGLSTASRSKSILYNMLAAFHYTHCEVLGKRVSRSTIMDQQAAQDSQSLNIFLRRNQKVAKTPLTAAGDIPSTTPAEKKTSRNLPSAAVAQSSGSSSTKSDPQENKKTSVKAEKQNSAVDTGEVQYPAPTFRPKVKCTHTMNPPASSGDVDWSPQRLEKSIATIVRNYDPVTRPIIVKKLAKIGYYPADAEQTVEACLRTFHNKKYIHYENGIAYCMD
eukprot:gene4479-3272_t